MKKLILLGTVIALTGLVSCRKHENPHLPPSYQIHDFSPDSARIGTLITLKGVFGGNPVVTFNGAVADSILLSSDSSKITCLVPQATSSGKIKVSFGSISVTSATDFLLRSSVWEKLSEDDGANLHLDGVSFVLGNKIYYGLGYKAISFAGSVYTADYNTDFRIFDPVSKTWSAGPTIPSAMAPRANASCMVSNGKAYIGGGTDTLTDWWEYDPSLTGDAAWKKIPSPDYPLGGGYVVAATANNTAYFGAPSGALYQFDATGNWLKTKITIFYDSRGGSCFLLGGYLYIIGGHYTGVGSFPQIVSTGFRYDLSNGQSSFGSGTFPFPIFGQPTFNLNDKQYILYNGSTYLFDPIANKWTDLLIKAPVFKGIGFPHGNAGLNASAYTYNVAVINGAAYAWTPSGQISRFLP